MELGAEVTATAAKPYLKSLLGAPVGRFSVWRVGRPDNSSSGECESNEMLGGRVCLKLRVMFRIFADN